MADLSERVKATILAQLDSSSGVTSKVPPSRIFPMQVSSNPIYPFLRYEQMVARAYELTCGEGVDVDLRIHAFAIGESNAHSLAAAVVASLDNLSLFQSCDWLTTQIIPDGTEADVWHAIVDFNVTHTE